MKAEARSEPFPAPTRIAIANADDVNIDAVAFARFCEAWGEAFGVLISTNAGATRDALIFNPGDAPSVESDESLPSVGVRFTLGRPAARSVALEWITGRGLDGYRWAIRYLRAAGGCPAQVYRYGNDPEQLAELRVPEAAGPHPVVVLIHGGGWKALWGKDLMVPLAVDLAQRGFASLNIEFRRLGNGGGWPQTFDDVAAAVDALWEIADEHALDLERVALLGHSSGAQLALWAAAEPRRVPAALVVSLSGMVDLVEAERRGLIGGENVTARLLGGGPADVPERYARASPRERLPLGVPQLLIQGLADYIPDLVDANRSYAQAAKESGAEVELIELEGVDHLQPIEPSSSAWAETREQLAGRLLTSDVGRGHAARTAARHGEPAVGSPNRREEK